MIMISSDENFRYERKFLIDNPSLNSFDCFRYYLPSDIYEAYPLRRVNSIYYDTGNLLLANQSKEGQSKRFKVRIRYYGESSIFNNPLLEIKSKIGNVGTKHKFKVEKIKLINNNFSLSYLLNNSKLPSFVNDLITVLKPIVFISYERSYYLEKFEKFRFTFDRYLTFKNIFLSANSITLPLAPPINYQKKVIELKYSKKNENDINNFIKAFPFRQTNFSKYRISLSELGILDL